jgi:hypothetical protein
MKKVVAGLAISLLSAPVFAQSVIEFDVVFDRVLEASGAFTPNLQPVANGPFFPSGALPAVTVTGHVIISAIPSSNELAGPTNGFPLAKNEITLNGTFSTQSGNSPSAGWATFTFNNAKFNLFSSGAYMATDFVSNPTNWQNFAATGLNGKLSDHGPAGVYGGSCPFFFGCLSANPGGSGSGASPVGWNQPNQLWKSGTPIFDKTINQPIFGAGYRNTGNHALISGSMTQVNAGAGIGFENGLDAFAYEGVLDTQDTQGLGRTSQPYADGVGGFPGKVRIVTFSNSGNTAYSLEGHIVYAAVPVPAAAWLFGSALGLLAWVRRRAQA